MSCRIDTAYCPHARGYAVDELLCDLAGRDEKAAGIPWYRRLWHAVRGEYDCPHAGLLPCARFDGLGNMACSEG